jgi:hypothetical protein
MKSPEVRKTVWNRFLRAISRPARAKGRVRLTVEPLEDRALLSVAPGLTLSGPTPPTQNMLYDTSGNPATNAAFGFQTGTYQQPGSNGLAAVPYADINDPYQVNFSSTATQPVQSSDWWSNLMFRLDPASIPSPLDPAQQARFAYGNNYLDSEPATPLPSTAQPTRPAQAWSRTNHSARRSRSSRSITTSTRARPSPTVPKSTP